MGQKAKERRGRGRSRPELGTCTVRHGLYPAALCGVEGSLGGEKNGAQEAVGRDSIQLQTRRLTGSISCQSGLPSVGLATRPVSTHRQKSRGMHRALTNNLQKRLQPEKYHPLTSCFPESGRRLSIVPSYSTSPQPCSDTDLGLPWQSSG